VGRRFEIRGEAGGITVVDDYGHHPTEIRATLQAARSCCRKRVHVLFQPHRYTRTFHLLDDFARAFHQADRVIVLDIYAASEKPIEGVSAESLVERMRQFGHRSAEYAGSTENGIEMIAEGAEPGDLILTLGAGSVSQAGEKILERLRARAGEVHA
jgi:UDP-N-acetylmuramate--alanine ligase